MSSDVNSILVNASSSSEVIRLLLSERKSQDRRCTLQWLCDQGGLSSTGFLSDILKGKRLLPVKHVRPVAKALGLNSVQTRCLATFVALDHEKVATRRAKLASRLAVLRKAIRIDRPPAPNGLTDLFFAIEVFCAFGLFRSQATSAQLVAYFGSQHEAAVMAALHGLERLGAIRLEMDERYQVINAQVLFGGQSGGLTHYDFLYLALKDALANVQRWFPHAEESHFSSTVISVDAKTYRSQLSRLKADLAVTQASMESGEADQLIRFNVQVYPLHRS